MAADLGKAYVQIMPSAKGIGNNIKKELEGVGADSGASFGAKFASMAKGLIAGAAIGKFVKDSINLGGELEQNLGGTQAVFGDFAKDIQTQAQEAYKNMGLSASDYMATANKMGSLFQGSGLSQQKSLDLTTQAMKRAADVASVMGIDTSMAMESIAGAAKGNFTMMDNLGVAMNATTLSAYALEKGINFKWNTASNAEKAELAMQMFMERTAQYEGNFARESEDTFSGSLGAMKAAAQDFMANLSLGNDISTPLKNLVDTAQTFLVGNLLPMIGNIVKAIPQALAGTRSIGKDLIQSFVQSIKEGAGDLVSGGVELIKGLVTGMIDNTVMLVQAAVEIGAALWEALSAIDWIAVGNDLMNTLKTGISNAATTLFGDGATIETIIASLTSKLSEFLTIGSDIVLSLVDGIMSSLPSLISMAGDLVIDFCNGLMDSAPQLLQQGVSLIVKLVEGIANGLPEIATKAGEVIGKFVEWTLTNLPKILELGIKLTGELAVGLIKAIPKVLEAVLNLAKAIIEKFKSMDWKTIGQNIIMGVGNGLKAFVSMVVTAAKETAQKVIDAFKNFFGIHSPSTKMIELAKNLIQGLINGIKNMAANAAGTMLQLGKSLIEKLNPGEWIERGKELGQKLGEGIGNAKETVSNKIGELADAARNKMNGVDLTDTGKAIGNSIANGIKDSKTNVTNQMDALINAISGKGQEAQNKINAIQYAATHAHLNGSVGTAEMYGAAGDTMETEEEAIINLLEKYLPIIASRDNSYNQLNREFGWAIQ